MQTETAIGAKLAAKGIFARDVKLKLALAEFQNNGGDYGVALAMLNAAYGKGSEGHRTRVSKDHGITANTSRKNDGEIGHFGVAEEAAARMPTSPSPKRNGVGLDTRAKQAAPDVPRPVSPAYIAAAKNGAKLIALTVLDSFKVRDGRSIGDVPFSSLDHLIAEGGREVTVLRMIRNRGRPTDMNSPIRLLVGIQEMERIIQKAAEMADVA